MPVEKRGELKKLVKKSRGFLPKEKNRRASQANGIKVEAEALKFEFLQEKT